LGAAGLQAPPSQPLPQGRHHIPGGRGWALEEPGGAAKPVPEESHPLGMCPPPRLGGGAGVKAMEEENGPCLIEAARKQSHLSGEDAEPNSRRKL